MNQSEFKLQPDVQEFVKWINYRCQPQGFQHQYLNLKPRGHWQCDSIYNAFERYSWPFSCIDPLIKSKLRGRDYAESSAFLSRVSGKLRQSVADNDDAGATDCCRAVMQWGGVLRRNERSLVRFTAETSLSHKLKEVQHRLDPLSCSLKDDLDGLIINSGFSKIYSLLVDDFVIYDSRVGAALGLLVRQFCEEAGTRSIPPTLLFAYANAPFAKGHGSNKNVRDPGNEDYRFPQLTTIARYIDNNMRANWLIKAITDDKDNYFQMLEADRMRAFEAALFMIGYKVW